MADLTRRQLSVVLWASATLTPLSAEEPAHDNAAQRAEALSKVSVPMAVEPAVHFRA